jgi:hypothetical protein
MSALGVGAGTVARDHVGMCHFYDGRSIAVFQHHGRWLVYLDHVLQKAVFATSEDAIAWLTQRIDQGVPARLH